LTRGACTDKRSDWSPHVDHGFGWRGAFRGLAHAHLGWLFLHTERAATERYAPDLLRDPVIRFVNKTSLLWVLLGLAVPFGLGVAIGDSIAAGLTGLLWGGAVRVFVLHHVTYSVNSLCHFFGRRRFTTGDQSRNLASLGEAWHNNHHAFPTSAFHGLHRFELDPLRTAHQAARARRPRLGRRATDPRAPSRPGPGLSGRAHDKAPPRALPRHFPLPHASVASDQLAPPPTSDRRENQQPAPSTPPPQSPTNRPLLLPPALEQRHQDCYDGGHGNLPTGGHRKSPLMAASGEK
jgi:hypothetical protein